MLEPTYDLSLLVDSVDELRQEAGKLYERCLTEGKTIYLSRFIEKQIIQSPPPLSLLNNIADDLHQRLVALREYYFDVRESVVQTFLKNYHLDITPFTPSTELESYHLLETHLLMERLKTVGLPLTHQETLIIQRMVDASLKMCSQLYEDIELTYQLQKMLEDWLMALQTVNARQDQIWDLFEIKQPAGYLQ